MPFQSVGGFQLLERIGCTEWRTKSLHWEEFPHQTAVPNNSSFLSHFKLWSALTRALCIPSIVHVMSPVFLCEFSRMEAEGS